MNQNLFILNGEWVIISNKKFKRLRFSIKKFLYGLRWKLVLPYLIISIVPFLIFSGIISKTIENNLNESSEKRYLNNANVLAATISKGNYLLDSSDESRMNLNKELEKYIENGRVLIFDKHGKIINDTNKTQIGKTFVIPEVLEALEKNDVAKVYNKEERVVYASATIVDTNSNVVGAVLIIADVTDSFEFLNAITTIIMILTIVVVIFLIILVYLTSKIIIDPVKDFLGAVEKISEGHLDQRVDVKGNDEFTNLAISFNNMTEKLEKGEKVKDEFVSNVSHELKTPLSSIKVLTESILLEDQVPIEMYREFLQDINSEIDRMTCIINDLLAIVRLDQTEMGINFKKVDLDILISDIMKRLYILGEQKKIDLRYEAEKNIIAEVDEMKLTLAISNLIENGIKYSDEGGIVRVSLEADHQNVFITIQDNGIGINDEDQNKVFTRFYRVDKTRDRETGGTGLGLAITHSTILVHNGSIKLVSKEGEGSTFTIRLPLKQQTNN